MPTAYSIYDIQIQNPPALVNDALIAAGGTVHVAKAGSPDRETIYDADSYLPASNPLTLVRGKIRFATLATVTSVDLYGIDAAGRFFVVRDVKPGEVTEVYPSDSASQVAVIPFSVMDSTAATEKDTGFDLPVGAMVMPHGVMVHVTSADATETVDVGLLSTESGGDADGFVDLLSVGTAGFIKPLFSGTPTMGALLVQSFGTSPAVNTGQAAVISTAVSISYTLTAGSDTAKGFVYLPYVRPVTA